MGASFRSAYGDIGEDRRRGGAYREPTPDEVVALLRSGEHRAVTVPPAIRSGEHRVTRAPMAGLVDAYRSWPRWGRILAPVVGVVLVLGLAGVLTGEEPVEHEAITTRDTAPPAAPAPTTTAPPATPAPTLPPSSVPIVTGPPATEPEAPTGVHYDSCSSARVAGAAPVRSGDPGYGPHLDQDGDGVGCE